MNPVQTKDYIYDYLALNPEPETASAGGPASRGRQSHGLGDIVLKSVDANAGGKAHPGRHARALLRGVFRGPQPSLLLLYCSRAWS